MLAESLYVVGDDLYDVEDNELNIQPVSSLIEEGEKILGQNSDFIENADWINSM